ncbi:MAG TPA: prephenate dehydrogenase [Candidatus Faeciplasma avium]|uniref:Prephenate dehydrogenase n=1 Tax=Candidatus Faeciplasma avium TaxID=2840798 RepID=A0A9D1NRH1_9FIRM|nr:prephenate dehydrogenase [Candidatus Faeciplasma avium]
MTAGIVGLGLIGGSFAKAYRQKGHRVLGWNRTGSVTEYAIMSGAIDGELTRDNISSCDIVLVSLYPEATISWLRDMGGYIGSRPIVIDCCGTKRKVCAEAFRIARECGFTFIGGHPMAGTQYSGLKHARANMYERAPMVIVPPSFDDIELLSRVKELLSPAGFGRITVTTAEKHDAMIAFTSQLAHVVSNAYVKSPSALSHKGFSAGSYKDLTRVAWLNAGMWAELFLENSDYLEKELDIIISNLSEYRSAIHDGDKDRLTQLLEDGKRLKEEIDG